MNLKERVVETGHYNKRERKQGIVPGVLYGNKIKNFMFEVGEMELAREIANTGEHGIINFNINGTDEEALIKEVQRDPVSHKIIHIDLEKISSDEMIEAEIPIVYEGEEYLNRKGAVLQKEKSSVKVSCSARDLPKNVTFNVGDGSMGSVYRFLDLELGSEISIVEDMEGVIASISNERKLVSELSEEEDQGEASEDNKEEGNK